MYISITSAHTNNQVLCYIDILLIKKGTIRNNNQSVHTNRYNICYNWVYPKGKHLIQRKRQMKFFTDAELEILPDDHIEVRKWKTYRKEYQAKMRKIVDRAESLGCTYSGSRGIGRGQVIHIDGGKFSYELNWEDWNDGEGQTEMGKTYNTKEAALKALFKRIAALHKRYDSDIEYDRHLDRMEDAEVKASRF